MDATLQDTGRTRTDMRGFAGRAYPLLSATAHSRGIEPRPRVLETLVLPLHQEHMAVEGVEPSDTGL